ncbi:MAG: hypothetical protein ATN33_05150 [Epulopiscium sp. Nele67-Bin001]|nr:MAG: hypothetical protein BEN18_03165 [Epulopiscium sp. Nuni2H_MBin001]OON93859.1 MAG: hypothetical protein ATN33_05150 [Epulopiscium sp. Nele67-Bin001]
MRCDYDKLSLYVDDELDEAGIDELEEHLKECEDCKNDLEILMQLKNELEQLKEYELPEHFHEDLMNNIKPKKSWYKYYVGLAASMLIVVVSFTLAADEIDSVPEPMSIDMMGARQVQMPVTAIIWELDAADKGVVEDLKLFIDNNKLLVTYFESDGQIQLFSQNENDYISMYDYIYATDDFISISRPADLPIISEVVINYPLTD